MSAFSYFTVVYSHDDNKFFIDDSFVGEYTGGNLYDDDNCEWFDLTDDTDEKTKVLDYEALNYIADNIDGRSLRYL